MRFGNRVSKEWCGWHTVAKDPYGQGRAAALPWFFFLLHSHMKFAWNYEFSMKFAWNLRFRPTLICFPPSPLDKCTTNRWLNESNRSDPLLSWIPHNSTSEIPDIKRRYSSWSNQLIKSPKFQHLKMNTLHEPCKWNETNWVRYFFGYAAFSYQWQKYSANWECWNVKYEQIKRLS